MRIWVTGSAGFVGYHLARRLLADGHEVVGIDGFTPYYDVSLKRARWAQLLALPGFHPVELQIEDGEAVAALAAEHVPEAIFHLAAQAGVRYSLEHPRPYVVSNLDGTFNIMEAGRTAGVRHFLFASTSSVYGANAALPFRENDRADHPLTLYAATKKAGEAMVHSYSHLWGMPATCLRFFTVYGPWGRPDMALFRFVEAIEAGEPIDVYSNGEMERDFTYVVDLVEAMARLLPLAPAARVEVGPAGLDSLSPVAPFRVVNIAGGQPVGLLAFIEAVEAAVGRKALRNLLPPQPGDMRRTWASPDLLQALTGYLPQTTVGDGVASFVAWWRDWTSLRR